MKVKPEWDKEFIDRLRPVEDEVHWLYNELYNDDHAYDYFLTMLWNSYQARSKDLRAWDRKRIKAGDWYKSSKMLGMCLSQTADFWGDVDGNQWNRAGGKLVPQRRQFGTKKIENSAIIRG